MEIQTSVAPAEIQLEVESTKGDFVATKRCWTLSKCCGRQSSVWEVRKKIRAKRGSLGARCRSRKTVTCHGLRVVEPVYHQVSFRGRWRSWKKASLQGKPYNCLFFKTHQIGLLLCLCAEPQTSREVDQDWEIGLMRQCNGRLRLCLYSLWFTFSITRRRRRASSPSHSSPTPASLVKTH